MHCFSHVIQQSSLLSAPALAVVSLQCCPGFGPGRPHFALQDEEQQHPHVAGGRNTSSLREKGGASLSFLLLKKKRLCCHGNRAVVFQVVAAYGAVPFPMMHDTSLPDALSACREALPWKSLSACPEAADGRCYGQLVTLKGFEGQRLIRSGTLTRSQFQHDKHSHERAQLQKKAVKATPKHRIILRIMVKPLASTCTTDMRHRPRGLGWSLSSVPQARKLFTNLHDARVCPADSLVCRLGVRVVCAAEPA